VVSPIKQIVCTSTGEEERNFIKTLGITIRITYTSRWKVTSSWWPTRTTNPCG